MVAPFHADPGDARGLRLLDRLFGGKAHHEVPHAVVAVNQRHAGRLPLDADPGLHVDRPALDAADVLGKPEHPVSLGALQGGAHHQLGDVLRLRLGYAHRLERTRGKVLKLFLLHAQRCRRISHDPHHPLRRSSSSTSAPRKSFGCTKAMRSPCTLRLSLPSPRTRAPFLANPALVATTSSTLRQKWWMPPTGFFSRNFE